MTDFYIDALTFDCFGGEIEPILSFLSPRILCH